MCRSGNNSLPFTFLPPIFLLLGVRNLLKFGSVRILIVGMMDLALIVMCRTITTKGPRFTVEVSLVTYRFVQNMVKQHFDFFYLHTKAIQKGFALGS